MDLYNLLATSGPSAEDLADTSGKINFDTASFFEKVWFIWDSNWYLFIWGTIYTLWIAILGTVLGLIIGLIFASILSMKTNEWDSTLSKIVKLVLSWIIKAYVWFFRGSPLLVQAILIYYGLKPILNWNPLTAGCVVLSLCYGAYMVEIVRAGIQSIDIGQTEGAESLGMTYSQTLFSILLPQAIRNTFPNIGNMLVSSIKDTSLLNAIGVFELYKQTNEAVGATYMFFETFFIATAIYLFLTTIFTYLLNKIEKKIDTGNVQVDYIGATAGDTDQEVD